MTEPHNPNPEPDRGPRGATRQRGGTRARAGSDPAPDTVGNSRAEASGEPPPRAAGFGRPPPNTRFKPGVSGNPAGRPRGAKSHGRALKLLDLTGAVLAEANRVVEVAIDGELQRITMRELAVRAVSTKAAQGSVQAGKLFTQLTQAAEAADERTRTEKVELALQFKATWIGVRLQYAAKGLPLPEVSPHPDDLVVNSDGSGVTLNGPANGDERREWEAVWDWLRSVRSAKSDLLRRGRVGTGPRGTDSSRIELEPLNCWILGRFRRIERLILALYPEDKIRRSAFFNLREWRLERLREFGLKHLPGVAAGGGDIFEAEGSEIQNYPPPSKRTLKARRARDRAAEEAAAARAARAAARRAERLSRQ